MNYTEVYVGINWKYYAFYQINIYAVMSPPYGDTMKNMFFIVASARSVETECFAAL